MKKLTSAFAARFFRKPGRSDVAMLGLIWAITFAAAVVASLLLVRAAFALPLSEADRVSVTIFDGADFSGKYQLNLSGAIELPYVGPVVVAGKEPAAAAASIASALVAGRFFQPDTVRVSVQVLELAPVEVVVEGAVFYPGRHRINLPAPRDRAPDRLEEVPGARLSERYLSDALRSAGGIRPTADIRNIELKRGESIQRFDLTGMMEGGQVEDVPLIAGDRVVVPDSGRFDARLARPSRITPPGIKVYLSNTTTGTNAAIAGSVGAISLPYGSRLIQAVVAGNCTGGLGVTTAGRRAVMVRTDRASGETTSLEVELERLLSAPAQSGELNPVLLEGDTISCFESKVATIRDVFRAITEIVLPLRLLSIGVL
jgi:polysaccharide export outer membrane protein